MPLNVELGIEAHSWLPGQYSSVTLPNVCGPQRGKDGPSNKKQRRGKDMDVQLLK